VQEIKMAELEKTISLRRGIGLAICMLIGTGILALPGLALGAGNVHEAILGWLLMHLLPSRGSRYALSLA
jgi:hypothetical protein